MNSLVKPRHDYIPMSAGAMERYATKVGLEGGFPLPLALGITNMMSYKAGEEVQYTNTSKFQYNTSEFTPDIRSSIEHKRRENDRKMQDFLKELPIDHKEIPGRTPAAKAMNVIGGILAQKDDRGPEGEMSNEEFIENFIHGNGAGRAAQMAMETLHNVGKIKAGDFHEKIIGQKVDDDSLVGIRAMTMGRELIQSLNQMNHFGEMGHLASRAKKSTEFDETSRKKKLVPIERYSQVGKVSPIEIAKPTFDLNLATKKLLIPKGVKESKSKQSLFMIVDDSGSMDNYHKISRLFGLYMNRLEAVCRGDANLYVCTFEAGLHTKEWRAIRDEAEAEKFMDDVRGRQYNTLCGGGTDMQTALEEAITHIRSGKLPTVYHPGGYIEIEELVDPSIIIINDGQDSVSSTYVPSMKTHGFILQGSHSEMQRFCRDSGGVYMQL